MKPDNPTSKNTNVGSSHADSASSPPVLPSIEPTRLYRQIANLIAANIDDGTFPIGSLLPAERVLAQQLSVSRTSVREALIALEVAGRVSVKVGHGVMVLQPEPQPDGPATTRDRHDDVGPIQLMQARRYIESETAMLAAASRTGADLEKLHEAMLLAANASPDDFLNYRNNDRAFHILIARASGNSAYPVIVEHLWDYCYQPLFRKFEELFVSADRRIETASSHQSIFDAIDARDPDGARLEMQRHIDSVRRAFSRELKD